MADVKTVAELAQIADCFPVTTAAASSRFAAMPKRRR
jgi:hypothetical protein